MTNDAQIRAACPLAYRPASRPQRTPKAGRATATATKSPLPLRDQRLTAGVRYAMNAYDRVRYPSAAAARTHPAVLSAFAALFGKPFAPFATARVLEIGCGEGVNLINMAVCAPGSQFVGVDIAETPIRIACATARALGLTNVRFHVTDIAHMDDSLG